MGITIKSSNFEINVGYGGFIRLRKVVASLCPAEIEKHYLYFLDNHYELIGDENAVKKYDQETVKLYKKYNKKYGKVIEFLYASDCGAELPYRTCKQLLDVIGDYDNNIIYGYSDNKRPTKFKDFKKILADCYVNKKPLVWY